MSRTLVIGSEGSGLTSKICIPAMEKTLLPILYVGREFEGETKKHIQKINSVKRIYHLEVFSFNEELKTIPLTFLARNPRSFEFLTVIDDFGLIKVEDEIDFNGFGDLIVTSHTVPFSVEKIKELFDTVLILKLSGDMDEIEKIFQITSIHPDDILKISDNEAYEVKIIGDNTEISKKQIKGYFE